MRVLVTGGAGFIGSHLVEALVARGDNVRVLDNFASGRESNLTGVRDAIELVQGDLCEAEVCRQACHGVERVFHLAAIGSVPFSVDHPVETHAINVTGTVRLLDAASQAGVERLIFASSCAVYGANPALPREEAHLPMPESPYAVTKLIGEQYLRQWARHYGLQTLSLRFFNIYGPRQDPANQYAAAVPIFITKLLHGEPPTIYGDGEQRRDFVYVKDAVQAMLLAATHPEIGTQGEILNVANGEAVTINALLDTVQTALGSAVTAVHAAPRPGDIRYSDGSNARIRQALGFSPAWTLDDGIAETVAWFKETSLAIHARQ